ncbi:MAG: HemK/PrmC family methyltransferase, partial [Candidatus Margulisiibacteriota bacterium]
MTWTIQSLLDWATEYFTKHGIELPHLEAEILLSHALKLKRIELYVQHERELKEEELAAFKPMILRRIKKEPIAYIIGHKPFMSLDFKVNPDVLIPRPETEKLVEIVIDIAKKEDRPVKILDLCCGSGAVAVSIAKYLENALISAADISRKAVETARLNAK